MPGIPNQTTHPTMGCEAEPRSKRIPKKKVFPDFITMCNKGKLLEMSCKESLSNTNVSKKSSPLGLNNQKAVDDKLKKKCVKSPSDATKRKRSQKSNKIKEDIDTEIPSKIATTESPNPKRQKLSLKSTPKNCHTLDSMFSPKSKCSEASSKKMGTTLKSETVEDEEMDVRPSFAGLYNLGNTCFLNSVLQVLRHSPHLQEQIEQLAGELKKTSQERCALADQNYSGDYGNEIVTWQLVRNLHEVFYKMTVMEQRFCDNQASSVRSIAVRPYDLLNSIQRLNPMFEGNLQQDAHEMLLCLLHYVQDATNELNKFRQNCKDICSAQKSDEAAAAPTSGDDTSKKCLDSDEREKLGIIEKLKLEDPPKRKSSTSESISVISSASNATPNGDSSPGYKTQMEISQNSENPQNMKQESKVDTTNKENDVNMANGFDNKTECLSNGDKLEDKSKPGCINSSSNDQRNLVEKTPTKVKRKTLGLRRSAGYLNKPVKNSAKNSIDCGKDSDAMQNENKTTKGALDARNPKNDTDDVNKQDSKLMGKSDQPKVCIEEPTNDVKQMKKEAIATSTSVILDKHAITSYFSSRKYKAFSDIISNFKKVDDCIGGTFQGKMSRRTRCLTCECHTERFEEYQDVNIPIRKEKNEVNDEDSDDEVDEDSTFEWMKEALADVEQLQGDNKYFCENCKGLNEAQRSTHYATLPPVLTLHLKRFASSSGFLGHVSKISDYAPTPLELPCMKDGCEEGCPYQQHRYELYASITHTGVSISSGHYIAYIKVPNQNIVMRDIKVPKSKAKSKSKGDLKLSSRAGKGTTSPKLPVEKQCVKQGASSSKLSLNKTTKIGTDGLSENLTSTNENMKLDNHSRDENHRLADPNNNADDNNNLGNITTNQNLGNEDSSLPAAGEMADPTDDYVWLECDDDLIKVISNTDFQNMLSRKGSVCPYILFYKQMLAVD